MPNHQLLVVTNTANQTWHETLSLSGKDITPKAPVEWSVEKGVFRGGLGDGVDFIRVDNGALSFTVLPTRGMGLWQGDYNGHYLGWRSPVRGPVHPRHIDLSERHGVGWLSGFDEWLCRCGLSFNGPPGEDCYTDDNGIVHRGNVTLHGRIANCPAHYVEIRINLDEPYDITVAGQYEEGNLFFPRLCMTTEYTTLPGSNQITIHDMVQNLGSKKAEMQLLYHCNMGRPFLEAGSKIVLPIREMSPISDRAAEGVKTHDVFAGPESGFAEQVYCYDLLSDEQGRTTTLLHNAAGDLGIALKFRPTELPCFTIWKNTAAVEDGYVVGLEPATNYPNFKTYERQRGRVKKLAAQEKWECTWNLEFFNNKPAVHQAVESIQEIQKQAKPIIHATPQDPFSAG